MPPRFTRAERRATRLKPASPRPENAFDRLLRERAIFAIASLLLVIPCFWHSRIQAGDLSSHIYNSWLAELIRQGRAPGLAIVFQSTNVLFDLVLGALFRYFGADAAQRIAVSGAALVFIWGAFAFISVAAGRRAWHMLPAVVVLAYGWVFHIGLFNFYLALGLSFWAMALAWKDTRGRLLGAAALLAIAYFAQNLAVAWAVALLAYRWISERITPQHRRHLLGAAILCLVALHAALAATMRTNWSFSQILLTSGADQAAVYDSKYELIAAGLLLVWVAMLWSSRRALSGILFQFCALTAAAIFVLPTWIWLPHYNHALVFIAERMSLAMGVLVCAALAAAPVRVWHRYLVTAVAALFFVFLYVDEGTLNKMEDQVSDLTSQLPPEQRVVLSVHALQTRTNPIDHMIDRVCIGHCFSYANYEPSSAAFRIRVIGPTGVVAPTDMDSSRMQNGGYAVKQRDLPLYRISLDETGRLVLQSMLPGALIGATFWNGF